MLVDLLGIKATDRCLEPHAGGGSFVRAMLRHSARVHASDIDSRCQGLVDAPFSRVADFLIDPPDRSSFDVIAGNPPYKNAISHAEQGLRIVKPGGYVAYLLRMGFLASKGRAPFWEKNPCRRVYILDERPSYTDGGTDRYDYAWFVWQRGWTGATTLHHLRWKRAVLALSR